MIIQIKALDTLFFRDGKPFSMGDDTWANGMFPPLPGVIYGAIRSTYMSQEDISLDEVIEKTQSLQIKNIWYEIEAKEENGRNSNTVYYPMPLDLVRQSNLDRKQQQNADKYNIYELHKTKIQSNELASNLGDLNITASLISELDTNVEGLKTGMISTTNLENYIKGQSNQKGRELEQYYSIEPKIGISRNNQTRTSEDGNLYRVGMMRTEAIKLLVEFENLDLKKSKGLMQLGAEKKLVSYQIIEDDIKTELRLQELDLELNDVFKIYLSTPAIFKKGFFPTKIFKDTKVKVELITCAVGKSIGIGGFDMKEKQPKIMEKAVPSGSVYYYRLLEGSWKDLENYIIKNGISESRSSEGFGIAFLAKLNES